MAIDQSLNSPTEKLLFSWKGCGTVRVPVEGEGVGDRARAIRAIQRSHLIGRFRPFYYSWSPNYGYKSTRDIN